MNDIEDRLRRAADSACADLVPYKEPIGDKILRFIAPPICFFIFLPVLLFIAYVTIPWSERKMAWDQDRHPE